MEDKIHSIINLGNILSNFEDDFRESLVFFNLK